MSVPVRNVKDTGRQVMSLHANSGQFITLYKKCWIAVMISDEGLIVSMCDAMSRAGLNKATCHAAHALTSARIRIICYNLKGPFGKSAVPISRIVLIRLFSIFLIPFA